MLPRVRTRSTARHQPRRRLQHGGLQNETTSYGLARGSPARRGPRGEFGGGDAGRRTLGARRRGGVAGAQERRLPLRAARFPARAAERPGRAGPEEAALPESRPAAPRPRRGRRARDRAPLEALRASSAMSRFGGRRAAAGGRSWKAATSCSASSSPGRRATTAGATCGCAPAKAIPTTPAFSNASRRTTTASTAHATSRRRPARTPADATAPWPVAEPPAHPQAEDA